MKTIEEAHAQGAADGRAGLGPIAPRDPALYAAYMQCYRDALVARVGVVDLGPPRRRNKRKRKPHCKGGAVAPCSTRRIRTRARNPKKHKPKRKPKPRRSNKRRAKVTTTVTRTVRKVNRRAPPRPLVVLYATRPGMRRLKYMGRGKFGEKGKPMLFRSAAGAELAAWVLRDSHPEALRGWTLKPS